MWINFRGQPRFARSVLSAALLTVSKAYIRSMNTAYKSLFCCHQQVWNDQIVEVFVEPVFGFIGACEARCVGTNNGDMTCGAQREAQFQRAFFDPFRQVRELPQV